MDGVTTAWAHRADLRATMVDRLRPKAVVRWDEKLKRRFYSSSSIISELKHVY